MNEPTNSEQPGETATFEAAVAEAVPSAVSGMGAVRLLALLFSLAACWLARDLLVPIMLGMLLALLANPMVTRLTRIWIPRWLGALVVVLGGLALAVSLASLLVGPASDWVKQAPTELRQLAPKLKKLTKQVEQANKAAASIVSAAGAAPTANSVAVDVDKPRPPNLWTLISSAPAAARLDPGGGVAVLFLPGLRRRPATASHRAPDRAGEEAADHRHPAHDRSGPVALCADHQLHQRGARADPHRRPVLAGPGYHRRPALGHAGRAAELRALRGSAERGDPAGPGRRGRLRQARRRCWCRRLSTWACTCWSPNS